MANWTERRFVILLPAYAIGLGIFFQYSGLELLIVSPFYDSENAIWPLKDHWLIQSVLHIFAQHLMKLFGLLLLGVILYLSFTKKNPPLRKALGCGFLAMAAGVTVVGYLKGQTRLYCPWDLEMFGGELPHHLLFQSLVSDSPIGHAFPSAHAAVGFSFLSVYFAAAMFAPQWRFRALGFGLGLGFLFGFVQQMRGAHFLSHDLFSLAICWLAALLIHIIFYRGKMLRFFFIQARQLQLPASGIKEAKLFAGSEKVDAKVPGIKNEL